MDLRLKFEIANACQTIKIDTLDLDRPYTITRAERVSTKYGATVVVCLAVTPTDLVKVFLPRRYANLFTDLDICNINDATTSLRLIYNGTCPHMRGFKLSLQHA